MINARQAIVQALYRAPHILLHTVYQLFRAKGQIVQPKANEVLKNQI